MGLSVIGCQHRDTILSTGQYLMILQNPNLKMVHQDQETKASKTIFKLAKYFGQNCLINETESQNRSYTEMTKRSCRKYT